MVCLMHLFVKISEHCSIPASRIVAVLSTSTLQGETLYKEKKADRTLLNTTGNKRVESVVVLDNGTVVSSVYTVDYITEEINRVSERIVKRGEEE